MRGAGGNFGAVTSFSSVHPVGPMVMVGAVFYAYEDAKTVLPAWRDYMAGAPDGEFSLVLLERSSREALPCRTSWKPVFIVAAAYSGSVEDEGPSSSRCASSPSR